MLFSFGLSVRAFLPLQVSVLNQLSTRLLFNALQVCFRLHRHFLSGCSLLPCILFRDLLRRGALYGYTLDIKNVFLFDLKRSAHLLTDELVFRVPAAVSYNVLPFLRDILTSEKDRTGKTKKDHKTRITVTVVQYLILSPPVSEDA